MEKLLVNISCVVCVLEMVIKRNYGYEGRSDIDPPKIMIIFRRVGMGVNPHRVNVRSLLNS
jgi:hypothetical protein